MSSLYVIRGKDQGSRFDLSQEQTQIGRGNSNTIKLKDTEISRQHAVVQKEGEQYSISDLDSSNGTIVNGKTVTQQQLRSGDRIQIGSTLLIFTSSNQEKIRDLSELIDITDSVDKYSQIVSSIQAGEKNSGHDSSWRDQSKHNLQIMYQTAMEASNTLDIDQLLNRILKLIFETVEADRGCVLLIDPETEALAPVVTSQRDADAPIELLEISDTILQHVLEHSEGVLTTDAERDSRWDSAASILKMGVREAICVPMQGRYGVVGLIYIDTFTSSGKYVDQKGRSKFNDDHLKLLIGIAHQAAIAVEDTNFRSAMIRTERLAVMGETIATLSHHIKNILQGIQGGSYLIEEGLKSKETEVIANGWKMVEKNQERISHMVLDMLSYSKEREPELVRNDLNVVVSDVIELMHTRAIEAHVLLKWSPDNSIPQLCFDSESLHRAILNVVTNAIDACRDIDEGQVEVRLQYDAVESIVAIIVSDNGAGIEPDAIERIFGVFESDKGSRGTGLGLSVSRKIMREHDGDIIVSSTPQVGSEFALILPFVAEQQAKHTAQQATIHDSV